jgi:hypothetical protein
MAALDEALWHLLKAETSCNLYWGEEWVPRAHEDLVATRETLERIGLKVPTPQPTPQPTLKPTDLDDQAMVAGPGPAEGRPGSSPPPADEGAPARPTQAPPADAPSA